MDSQVLYPSRHYNVDPKTGVLGPEARNSPALPSKSFSSSIWSKMITVAALFLGFALIAACVVIPLSLLPALTRTASPTDASVATTSTTVTTTTTLTTTTAVTMFIPRNYYTACFVACTNVTTATSATLLASWKFDNNLFDSTSNYHGLVNNGSTYTSGYVDQALFLNNSEYVTIPSPFLNLANRPFTVEAWIYLLSLDLSADNGLFGQCHNFSARHCLHYVIRAKKLYMGFWREDARGITDVPLNTWFHAAFVYNTVGNTQSIYLNGVLDGFDTTNGPYEGSSGISAIGQTTLTNPGSPLNGYIDHVTVSNRVKSRCEILNDATLVSRFSFDNSMADSGPNSLTAFSSISPANGMSYVTGRVNGALMLTLPSSFFQACSYTALARPNSSYTFALWINPSAPFGTILHLSAYRSGSSGWCIPMLGFSSNGSVVAQSYSGVVATVLGPQIPTNDWTHVAQTWSSTNGLQLYINGGLYGWSPMGTFAASGNNNMCIFLGTSGFGSNCVTSSIVTGSYVGAVDEFYVYNRELTPDEICPLAHP